MRFRHRHFQPQLTNLALTLAVLCATKPSRAQESPPPANPIPASSVPGNVPAAERPPEKPPEAPAGASPTQSVPAQAGAPASGQAAVQAAVPMGQPVAAESRAAPIPPPAPPPNPAGASAKWYDNLRIGAFADAYYSYNFNQPHPEFGTNSGGLPVGGNLYRAYDFNNGFSLHWAGIDAAFAYGEVGGTVSLRFGPSTVPYNANDLPFGGQFIKQAFATWKPLGATGPLAIDFGKYDQPFGSEVADSQLNLSYTRSLLYLLAQPLYFTGVRVDYALAPEFDLKFFVVNGWNRVADNNAMKDFGAQVMIKPAEQAILYVGYLVGAEQPDAFTATPPAGAPAGTALLVRDSSANGRLRHLVDFVADLNPTPQLRFLFNADYGTEKWGSSRNSLGFSGTGSWYGANLVVGIKPTDQFLFAPRGEVYREDNWINVGANTKRTLYQGTLTFGYLPNPNLILKLDARGDFANEGTFPSKTLGALSQQQFTATLGVVATTN